MFQMLNQPLDASLSHNHPNQTLNQISPPLPTSLSDQITSQMMSQMNNQSNSQMMNQMNNQLGNQTQMNNQTMNSLLNMQALFPQSMMFQSAFDQKLAPLQSLSHLTNQTMSQPMNQTINTTINPLMNQTMNHLMSQSINQPLNQPVYQVNYPSAPQVQWCMLPAAVPLDRNSTIDSSINQSMNQPLNLSMNSSMNQINNPSNQTLIPQSWIWAPNMVNNHSNMVNNPSPTQPVSSPLNQTMSPAMQQSINQPLNQAVNQSKNSLYQSRLDQINQSTTLAEQANKQGSLIQALVLMMASIHRPSPSFDESNKQSINQNLETMITQSNERSIAVGRAITDKLLQLMESNVTVRDQLVEELLHLLTQSVNLLSGCSSSIWGEFREILQRAFSFHKSFDQINQSFDQSVNQSVEQSVNESAKKQPLVHASSSPFLPMRIGAPASSFNPSSIQAATPSNKQSTSGTIEQPSKILPAKLRSFLAPMKSISSTNVRASLFAGDEDESSDDSAHQSKTNSFNIQSNSLTSNQTIDQSNGQTTNPSNGQPQLPTLQTIDLSNDTRRASLHSIRQLASNPSPISISTNQSISQTNNQSNNQTINQMINHSNGDNLAFRQTINQPIMLDSFSHPTPLGAFVQSVNQSANQTMTNPSISQSIKQTHSHPSNTSFAQFLDPSKSQETDSYSTPIGASTAECRFCHRVWSLAIAKDRESLTQRNRQLKSKRDHVPYCRRNPDREKNLGKRRAKKELAKRLERMNQTSNQSINQNEQDAHVSQPNSPSHNQSNNQSSSSVPELEKPENSKNEE